MKKMNLLITLIILFILSLFFLNNKLNIENYFLDILSYPYNYVSGKEINPDINYLTELNNNKDKELSELKDLLELEQLNSTYKIINATIINRSMEYFYDEVTIDKGTNNGIKENMAVVNNKGLIGKIIRSNKNNALVKLITSRDVYNMLSVQIELNGKYVYGILNNYDSNSNSFIIEGIDENIDIKVGSLVSTTGIGSIYPSGIVIGKVVRIQKDNFDLAYILKVEPFIEFNSFNYVAVLDREFDD